MPGPPPPSKSYLLKFDSSSSEDEDDCHMHNYQPPSQRTAPTEEIKEACHENLQGLRDASSIKNPNSNLIDMFRSIQSVEPSNTSVGEQAQTSNSTEPFADAASAKKKRKKKRKKKKKKKSNSVGIADSIRTKKVTFSEIHIAEFRRDIISHGVPCDGGWPLALSNDLHREFVVDVDEFERKKKIELRQRYEKFVIERRKIQMRSGSGSRRRTRSNSKSGEELKKNKKNTDFLRLPVYIPEDYEFESRQFDYKERSTDKHRENGKDAKMEWDEIYSIGKNALFGQLCESERKKLFSRDVQSSSSEEIFCSQEVKHIRNELEQIRIHRSAHDAAGCSCRKLHVVLSSELNGGKKSHHHRRLTERKVKDELRRRHVSFEGTLNREQLEQLLHDTVEEQGCCYGNDCPCARSGIGCQADTCSCWHTSHVTHRKNHGKDENISPADAQVRCGNRNGLYAVDFGAIAKHRALFCKAVDNDVIS